MALAQVNFQVSSVDTISLSGGDVTTDLLSVVGVNWFSVEAINTTGLDGSPTYSIKATNVDDSAELKDFNINTNNIAIDDAIIYRDITGVNYFALEILVNDNTTGSTEFIVQYG